MNDPRLNGDHLCVARFDQYGAAVEEMLDNRGPATTLHDPFVRDPAIPRAPHRRDAPPPGGTYRLVSLDDGVVTCLRTGINAIGRFQDNDIVLEPNHVSRRHCVILVHATGSCEVYDTASRNGTWVNHRRVGRVYLLPGDSLMLSGERFVIDWIGPNGESLPAIEESGSSEWGGSATCVSL